MCFSQNMTANKRLLNDSVPFRRHPSDTAACAASHAQRPVTPTFVEVAIFRIWLFCSSDQGTNMKPLQQDLNPTCRVKRCVKISFYRAVTWSTVALPLRLYDKSNFKAASLYNMTTANGLTNWCQDDFCQESDRTDNMCDGQKKKLATRTRNYCFLARILGWIKSFDSFLMFDWSSWSAKQ